MQKSQKRIYSTIALCDYLKEIISNPSTFAQDNDLAKSLHSQSGTAKLKVESRNIMGFHSINTLKAYADDVVEGGFLTLDQLRKAALESINNYVERNRRSNKTTKAGLTKRVKEQEIEVSYLRQDLLLLTIIIEKSLRQGRQYAEQSNRQRTVDLCEKEQGELRRMLSLSRPVLLNVGKVNG